MERLEFKRTSKFNKERLSPKVLKDWISTKPQRYHIRWRKQVFGVQVLPGYQATFLCYTPGNGSGKVEMWAFVDRPLYRTLKKAQDACNKHYLQWEKALLCTSMRGIKGIFGKKPHEMPRWIYGYINRQLMETLMDTSAMKYSDDDEFEPGVNDNEEWIDPDYDDVDAEVEPEPEPEPEPVKKRKQRSDKGQKRKEK
jgi:hypothetical protein